MEQRMLMTLEGLYRNGKIELTEPLDNHFENTPVIVTFLAKHSQSVSAFGLNESEAGELRSRLISFAQDWDNPDMDIYDDYDLTKANLPTR